MSRNTWLILLLLAGLVVTARLIRRATAPHQTPSARESTSPESTAAETPAPEPSGGRENSRSSPFARRANVASPDTSAGLPARPPADIRTRLAELEADAYAKAPYLKYCEENRNSALDQLQARFPSGTQSFEALLASPNPAITAQRRQLAEMLKRLVEPLGAQAVLTNPMLAAIEQELMEDRPELLTREASTVAARLDNLRELGVTLPDPALQHFIADPTYAAWTGLMQAAAGPALARIEALVNQSDVGRELFDYLFLESVGHKHTVLFDAYIDTHTPPELRQLRIEARNGPAPTTSP